MDEDAEHHRYYPDEENVPLSVAITETVSAHEDPAIGMEEFDLFDHIDPDALNRLFSDSVGIDFSMQFRLADSVVEVWGDGSVDIRVTDADRRR